MRNAILRAFSSVIFVGQLYLKRLDRARKNAVISPKGPALKIIMLFLIRSRSFSWLGRVPAWIQL